MKEPLAWPDFFGIQAGGFFFLLVRKTKRTDLIGLEIIP